MPPNHAHSRASRVRLPVVSPSASLVRAAAHLVAWLDAVVSARRKERHRLEARLDLSARELEATSSELSNKTAEGKRARYGAACPICHVPLDRALADGCGLSHVIPDRCSSSRPSPIPRLSPHCGDNWDPLSPADPAGGRAEARVLRRDVPCRGLEHPPPPAEDRRDALRAHRAVAQARRGRAVRVLRDRPAGRRVASPLPVRTDEQRPGGAWTARRDVAQPAITDGATRRAWTSRVMSR